MKLPVVIHSCFVVAPVVVRYLRAVAYLRFGSLRFLRDESGRACVLDDSSPEGVNAREEVEWRGCRGGRGRGGRQEFVQVLVSYFMSPTRRSSCVCCSTIYCFVIGEQSLLFLVFLS